MEKNPPTGRVPESATKFDGHAMLRECGPRYAKLHDRFMHLSAREDEIIARLRIFNAGGKPVFSSEGEAVFRAVEAARPVPMTPPQRPGVVAALGGVMAPSEPKPLASANAPLTAEQRERLDLSAELQDIRAAIVLIRSEMEREHFAATLVLVEKLGPSYEKIAAYYLSALIAFAKASEDYTAFIDSIKTSAWSAFRPIMITNKLGRATEYGSEINRILSAAIATGRLGPGDFPLDWPVEIRR